MSRLTDNEIETRYEPKKATWLYSALAFRPFFWFGALFSIICIATWLATFNLGMAFSPFGGSYFWHIHEMLFGFVAAIMVGFLLTAVQSWTHVSSLKGWPLFALVSLWVIGRLAMAAPALFPGNLTSVIDLAFLPLSALCLARPIVKAKMWRNLMFIPILLIMAGLNGWMHYSLSSPSPVNFLHLSHAMIMLVSLVMGIIGGRVFPMFTANGTQTKTPPNLPWLDKLAILSIAICAVMSLEIIPIPGQLRAGIYVIAGLANLARAFRWRIWVTLRTPLLWSLHVSYWAMAVGLVLVGLSTAGLLTSASSAYHTITVGGVGLMILSMISRVSLGHTGRQIVANTTMTWSFFLIIGAAAARIAVPFIQSNASTAYTIAGVLWILSYGLFLIGFTKTLFSPRIDGKDG